MKQHTIIRSKGAMALGLFFAGTTLTVLCEDVLLHGAPLTIQHLLTVAALVGSVTAGHMSIPHLKQGRVIAALGLGILFCAGTIYTVISAGSRNAEMQIRKAEVIGQSNAERTTIEAERAAAERMLDEERRLLSKECKSGDGAKCKGISKSIAVYEAAVRGHTADLAKLAPVRAPNAGYAHAAKVLAALPFVTVPAGSIEVSLNLLMPFLLVVIVEFGTLVWFSVALCSEACEAPQPPAARAPIPERVETDTAKVADFAKRYREKHGTNPTQAEIRTALDLPKATTWRIYHELRLAA